MPNGDVTLSIELSGTLSSGESIRRFLESKLTASIADVFDRTINVPTSLTTILTLGAVAAAGLATLNGLIIYNEDPSNFVRIGLVDTGVKSSYHKVLAGQFFLLMNDQFDTDDDTGATFNAFTGVDTINAIADTAACRLRVVAW